MLDNKCWYAIKTRTNNNGGASSLLIFLLYIAILIIAFNLFGNGLRDAFNPSLRGAE